MTPKWKNETMNREWFSFIL